MMNTKKNVTINLVSLISVGKTDAKLLADVIRLCNHSIVAEARYLQKINGCSGYKADAFYILNSEESELAKARDLSLKKAVKAICKANSVAKAEGLAPVLNRQIVKDDLNDCIDTVDAVREAFLQNSKRDIADKFYEHFGE